MDKSEGSVVVRITAADIPQQPDHNFTNFLSNYCSRTPAAVFTAATIPQPQNNLNAAAS